MSDALGVLGDRHSLSLLREVLYGYRRFSELATLTGAPRTLLTARLRSLEEAGVLERREYSAHPPRHEYHLTAAGHALVPILVTLKEWGERFATAGEPWTIFRHTCGAELHPVTCCAACREEIRPGEFEVAGGAEPVVLRP